MTTLPTDYTNDTPSADTHPAAHNNTNAAVNTLQAELDTLEATVGTNTTAAGRLPKGQVALLTHAGGTIMQGTPLTVTTAAVTMTGRRVRISFRCFARAAGGALTLEASLTAPGLAGVLVLRQQVSAGAAGSISHRDYSSTYPHSPSGDGTVSVQFANQTATNSLVVDSIIIYVDDMGAV
jgi:hypothetical protein